MTNPAVRRRRLRRAVLALSLVMTGAADAASDPAAVVDAYHAALKNRDTRAALDLVAADAVLYEQGFVERGRAAYAGAHVTADADFAAATRSSITDRKLLWLGDQSACVLTETRTVGRYQDQPLDLVGTETALLRRVGDGWLIQHLHTSAHPAPDAGTATAPAPVPARPAPK